MIARGFDDASGDFVEREVVSFDTDVGGIAVEWCTDTKKIVDCFFGIVVVEKRAICVPRSSFQDFSRVCDEPDDVAEFSKELAVFGAANDSSAGGNNMAGVFNERFEEFGFHVAKRFLTIFFENCWNGAALLLDNELVGVNERVAEGLGEVSPKCGLSRSHKSDEDNVLLHTLGKTLPFWIRFAKLYLLNILRGHKTSCCGF